MDKEWKNVDPETLMSVPVFNWCKPTKPPEDMPNIVSKEEEE